MLLTFVYNHQLEVFIGIYTASSVNKNPFYCVRCFCCQSYSFQLLHNYITATLTVIHNHTYFQTQSHITSIPHTVFPFTPVYKQIVSSIYTLQLNLKESYLSCYGHLGAPGVPGAKLPSCTCAWYSWNLCETRCVIFIYFSMQLFAQLCYKDKKQRMVSRRKNFQKCIQGQMY